MKKPLFLIFAFLVFCSHDMFLKLDTYFLASNSQASLKLFNGTFEKSENVITRDRMIDVSLLNNSKVTKLDSTNWTEKDSATILHFNTGDEGTYVVGVSTKARNIELEAASFNSYLEHDGVLDMIKWREENNAKDEDAIEKYSKHVKTIFQVGETKTKDWATVLGYPIEFVPMSNPYELHSGHALDFKLLFKGKPLANQLVYSSSKAPLGGHTHVHEEHESSGHSHNDSGSHSHEDSPEDAKEDHTHSKENQWRTNSEGIVSINLNSEGIWYLRTIHMELSKEQGLTHESNWATITFEVGHGHEHGAIGSLGLPSYIYWLASLAVVGITFLWFYRRVRSEED